MQTSSGAQALCAAACAHNLVGPPTCPGGNAAVLPAVAGSRWSQWPGQTSYSLSLCFLMGKVEIMDPIDVTDRAVVEIKPQCFALSIDLTFHNYDIFQMGRPRTLGGGHSQQGNVQRTRSGKPAGGAAVSIWKPLTRSRNQSREVPFLPLG